MNANVRKAYKRRLRCLEEIRAYYGIDTPPHILMEVEDIEHLLKEKFGMNGTQYSDPAYLSMIIRLPQVIMEIEDIEGIIKKRFTTCCSTGGL